MCNFNEFQTFGEGRGGVKGCDGGERRICYRYLTKVYISTLLSVQVFHVRGKREILLIYDHNLNFHTMRVLPL